MKQYIIETHCHTAETSSCGKVSSERIAELYYNVGYSGIVVTDHMNGHQRGHENERWEDKITAYLSGYRALREAAKGKLDVMLGMELAPRGGNHYLLFGLTEELIYKYNTDDENNFMKMRIEKLREFTKEHGILLIQAHPFRFNNSAVNPVYLDGIEAYNVKPTKESNNANNNEFSALWANKYNLIKTSGSDFHHERDVACGGIITDYRIENLDILLETLKNGTYSLKVSS